MFVAMHFDGLDRRNGCSRLVDRAESLVRPMIENPLRFCTPQFPYDANRTLYIMCRIDVNLLDVRIQRDNATDMKYGH